MSMTRTESQAAAQPFAWRYLLGKLVAVYPVASLAEATDLARVAASAAPSLRTLSLDLRSDRVRCSLFQPSGVDASLVAAMAAVATAISEAGWTPAPPQAARYAQPVTELELCIDTADAKRIRPFWAAALGLEVAQDGSLVDPTDRLPAIWFQEMDPVRSERNRLHLDVTVAHDEAEARIAAVISAGGVVGATSSPPSFTVLIDADGNEVCICTWTGRDEAH